MRVLQVFLVFLTAVTFVLMAVDPRPTDSTEAKSAWTERAEERKIEMPEVSAQPKRSEQENKSEQG